ncbi:hypothetical protein [Cellulomonas wangsupingiae]|uniref:Type III PLP-dependent enzyme n=1 Tax=Cellulomonas wangsupingiae TaxID=2968085 RepID=A0ABY5KBE4_9CELL|nr:hypothetical protein [Cellulomonas wangsupingiae]MCC2333045.1 hypothetical protein [Cellulomonas wangsupingiae]MCM0640403.1 hypothetical protein [Cellulomonas wangsupingiae]UUI66761.1 hypothetical protein NP075_08710 [Cellulomonas wangsupingiae]
MPDVAALTPAYVYDLDEVGRCHDRLRAALPAPSDLYYSLKANPHPVVVARLAALGCRVEVCSTGELDAALAAGVLPAHVLCTGPGKPDAEVAHALLSGVSLFSVDSPHGLDQVDRLAARHGLSVDCLLRVNDAVPTPGQGLAMTGVPSAFGADADWVEAEPERFTSRACARLTGFHLYMGSNLTDQDALVAQFATSARTARRLSDVLGIAPGVLDLGGGFGAPFARCGASPDLTGLAERVADVLDVTFPGWRHGGPRVAFESGRYLTATCGRLRTRVLDVKVSHGRRVVVLESGIHHLGGMSGLRRLPTLAPELVRVHDTDERAVWSDVMVAGPLCTPLDTWARSATVEALRPGDVVEVPNVGAYGLTASLLAFLGHPAPHELVLDEGVVVHASRLTLSRSPVAGPPTEGEPTCLPSSSKCSVRS